MNPIFDTIIIGVLIVLMIFLVRGYHKIKNYEEDDTYLSQEEREQERLKKQQEDADASSANTPKNSDAKQD